jgi:hypothetical protein
MERWAEVGFRANANRATSSPHERAVLDRLGAVHNNAPEARGGQLTSDYAEYVDRNGRSLGSTTDPETGESVPAPPGAVGVRETTARPDGYIENADGTIDIVEHKHLRGEDAVLEDSVQLRAEREMARAGGGEHIVVLTSDAGLDASGQPQVRPSSGVAAGSTVLYYDAPSGTMMRWTGSGYVPHS